MINELLFFAHLLVNIIFLFYALRKGEFYLKVFHAFQIFLANFFVYKQIKLFSLDVTASDVFAIGAFLSLNLIREYFGKKSARSAIWSSFFILTTYIVMARIHLIYEPNIYDESHLAYALLINPSARLLGSSLLTFFLVQRIDLFLFQIFKKIWPNLLSLRVFSCLAITNLIDTAMFSFLGLYGLVHNIFEIMIVSYVIKMFITLLSSPFLELSKKIHKNINLSLDSSK
jgi:queuosine precursor transporter